ncbi:hypothetical protein [Rhodococcus sp. NPDC047139]|uniref:hypothetical protein n=1 Tax=Rhodococcus sp. NPDC047139 TaxID=3155141 RepID=UPI0033C9442E
MSSGTSELMSRRRFAQWMGISSAGEARGRTGGGEWPPHVRIGHKVYYRREAVERWLREQEQAGGRRA